MCDNAADSCLVALKCVPGKFVLNNMIGKLDSLIFCIDYIDFRDLDSDFLMFFSRDIHLKGITLDKINWMMIIFIFVIQKQLIIWYDKDKQSIYKKIDEKLLSVSMEFKKNVGLVYVRR